MIRSVNCSHDPTDQTRSMSHLSGGWCEVEVEGYAGLWDTSVGLKLW